MKVQSLPIGVASMSLLTFHRRREILGASMDLRVDFFELLNRCLLLVLELVLLMSAGRVLFGITRSCFFADFKPQFDVKVETLVSFGERKISLRNFR